MAAKILEPGPIGERGRNGSKGPTGEKGQPGLQGPRGDKGPEGDQGDKGLPGDNGFPGTNGRKGLTGDTGSKGPKGDNGTVGPTGDTGVQGPRGIGNFSWCQHKKVSVKKDDIPGQKATASDNQVTEAVLFYNTILNYTVERPDFSSPRFLEPPDNSNQLSFPLDLLYSNSVILP